MTYSLPDPRRIASVAMTFIALAVLWTIPAVMRAAEQYTFLPAHVENPFLTVLPWRLWEWWFWIPISGAIHAIVRRQILSWRTLSSCVVNVGAALTVMFLHRAYSIAGAVMFTGVTPRVTGFRYFLPNNVVLELLTYAAIVGVCVALESTSKRAQPGPIERPDDAQGLAAPFESHAVATSLVPRRIEVKSGPRRYFISIDEVRWIEADGYCAKLHTRTKVHRVRLSLRELEHRLGGHGFARVHRSALVSLRTVKELRAARNGRVRVVLDDGSVVVASRDRAATLRERLAHIADATVST